MIAIVGLGNPGEAYVYTRHNLGFMVIDELANKAYANAWERSNWLFGSDMTKTTYANKEVTLIKPATFMNNSGQVVSRLQVEKSLHESDIWVIHDDAEIAFGEVRVKNGGTSAGHNGINSIDQAIGYNYWRIRVGIGRNQNFANLSDFVLAKFSNEEQQLLPFLIDQVTSHLLKWIEEGIEPVTFYAFNT